MWLRENPLAHGPQAINYLEWYFRQLLALTATKHLPLGSSFGGFVVAREATEADRADGSDRLPRLVAKFPHIISPKGRPLDVRHPRAAACWFKLLVLARALTPGGRYMLPHCC